MARKAQVRWFESKNGYYCTHNGVRYRLGDGPEDFPHGPNYQAALDRWKEIVFHDGGRPDVRDSRVIACVERWTENVEKLQKTATLDKATHCLQSAVKRFGSLLITQLQPYHVRE